VKRLVAGILIAIALVTMQAALPVAAADHKPAVMLLNSLPVSPEHPAGYVRELFGDWRQVNGCDTRQRVLAAERLTGRVVDCEVVSGTWRSPYDGVLIRSASGLQIDHRVPLAEAWESGAWRWTDATRHRYANDQGYAASLVAATVHTNESKGEREPREWMPPLRSQRCSYIKLWIGVKYRWRLSVDAAEKSFLTRALRGCNPVMTVPRRAVVSTR
jgi:hypothetical protein